MTDERAEAMLDEERLAVLRRVLEGHAVSFAMLFGSTAHRAHTPESDVDLAVEFDDVRPADDGYSDAYLGLLTDLEESLTTSVDVVDVHSLTPRFARAVFDSGVVVIGDDERRAALERDLAADSLSIDDARERVATAVERLEEDA